MSSVVAIRIHPFSGSPAVDLESALIEAAGLNGDRRKKAAVHLVSSADAATTRANIVVAASGSQLLEWVGRTVGLGTARLRLTRPAGSCAGVYAEVITPGRVDVGMPVDLAEG